MASAVRRFVYRSRATARMQGHSPRTVQPERASARGTMSRAMNAATVPSIRRIRSPKIPSGSRSGSPAESATATATTAMTSASRTGATQGRLLSQALRKAAFPVAAPCAPRRAASPMLHRLSPARSTGDSGPGAHGRAAPRRAVDVARPPRRVGRIRAAGAGDQPASARSTRLRRQEAASRDRNAPPDLAT